MVLADGFVPFGPRNIVDNTQINPRTVAAGDIDLDGDIDLAAVYLNSDHVAWYENPTLEFDGDVNRDGGTDSLDLAALLALWGATGPVLQGDLNNDGTVDAFDLAIVLAAWGHSDR